eukprot:1211701-Pyramimonas_sp.AAC.1
MGGGNKVTDYAILTQYCIPRGGQRRAGGWQGGREAAACTNAEWGCGSPTCVWMGFQSHKGKEAAAG